MSGINLHLIISTLVRVLIGWILIEKVPAWLNLSGLFATVIKIIGILIILSALFVWV